MNRAKLVSLLEIAYEYGYEDGITFASSGVKCNDFNDLLTDSSLIIDELLKIDDNHE